MAKSLRSKIKRKFRTELRKRVGVPHLVKQEAKIQENLKKAIAAQGKFYALSFSLSLSLSLLINYKKKLNDQL
jgi:hypothetical protein